MEIPRDPAKAQEMTPREAYRELLMFAIAAGFKRALKGLLPIDPDPDTTVQRIVQAELDDIQAHAARLDLDHEVVAEMKCASYRGMNEEALRVIQVKAALRILIDPEGIAKDSGVKRDPGPVQKI